MTDVVENITVADLEQLEGYVLEPTKSPYELIRKRNSDHLLILYSSGKLVVQGEHNPFASRSKSSSKTSSTKKSVIDDTPTHILPKSIGSDETLKGDTFGGLIVCGAYFEQDEIEAHDSKSYSEHALKTLAYDLLSAFPERFCIKELTPVMYNQLYAELGSQTAILNMLHEDIGRELKKKFDAQQVVDKYPGCIAGDIMLTKAESHYTSVAAASIVARYKALLQFEKLSLEAGYTLPKGSTHVKEALVELKNRKLKIDLFCKMHFSTVMNR